MEEILGNLNNYEIIEYTTSSSNYLVLFIPDRESAKYSISTSIDKNDIESSIEELIIKYKNIFKEELEYIISSKITNISNFITLKNCEDNFSIIYDNNMTKHISLNKYSINDFILNFEREIIEKYQKITPLYEKENRTLISILDDTFDMIGNKTKTLDKFLIINEDLVIEDDIYNKFKVFKTSYIKDEVIFGYITDSTEPGITVFYDENTLNKDEICLTISEIGYFPSASYRRFKI